MNECNLLYNDVKMIRPDTAGRSSNLCMFVFISLFVVLAGIVPITAAAQTGVISGQIEDAATGEALPGANVIISGLGIGAATDIDGRYTIRRVPTGNYTVQIRYLGFVAQDHEITVVEDERLELNAKLHADMIEGSEVLVVARQRGQSRSLTRQRQSVNIRSVISSEQMDGFADQTVEGALQRVAGMGHGGTNIRGVGVGRSSVTIDGQRMGSTGTGDRSVDLSTISADVVQELDVIKVLTPDMPADALSGVINISTRRPVGGDRSMNARLGGSVHPRYAALTGAGWRTSLSFGDSPTDKYSYGVNFSYQNEPRTRESFAPTFETRNMENYGLVDLLTSLTTQLQFENRERYSTGAQLTFQPTDRTTYHVQGMFNYQDRLQHQYDFGAHPYLTSYRSPSHTAPGLEGGGSMGQFYYSTQLTDYSIHQYTVQAGARHLFDQFDMEYKLGWGHGRYFEDRYRVNFDSKKEQSRWDFHNIDISDRWNPTLDVAPWGQTPVRPENVHLRRNFRDNFVDFHVDNEITGSIDFEVPFRLGSFKFGGNSLMTFKRGDEEHFSYDEGRHGPGDYPQRLLNSWNALGRDHWSYEIPMMMDMVKFRDMFHSRYPTNQIDVRKFAESELESYYVNENVFAVYGMATITYRRFNFLSGLRIEHTYANYEAREGLFDGGGVYQGALNIGSTKSYTDLFPNAQIVYALGDLTNVRAAYSRTIGRPNFNQLSPYRVWDYSSRRIRHGNPDLNPMRSNNLDLVFEHYFLSVGQVNVGLFYKSLSDFVFSETRRVPQEGFHDFEGPHEPEEYIGWVRSTFLNGEEAEVYGIETTWQQNLTFLPGFLAGLGTYVTYTYTQSHADIGRRVDGENVKVRLMDQRPHVVNVGLDYNHNRFTGQISYHWSSPSVSSYASTPRWVPVIQTSHRVFFDSYRDAANDLSATLRYRFTSNFILWIDGANLLNHRSIDYDYDREYYPSRMSLRGRELNLGIRYTF